MCPHGYHHSGSMATPALGTRDVRLHIVWIALWSHQSAQYIYIYRISLYFGACACIRTCASVRIMAHVLISEQYLFFRAL